MQTYNFKNIQFQGTNGESILYTCSDNGMPLRPEMDNPEYDPTQLYFGTYRNSIILSLDIVNNSNYPIKGNVFVTDNSGTRNDIHKDIIVNPNTTAVLVGGDQKIVLEYEDAINLTYNSNYPIVDSDIHIMVSIINIYNYDFISVPMFIPTLWHGNKAYVGFGSSSNSYLSTFMFDSRVITNSVVYAYYMYYGDATSNMVTGVLAGGYSSMDNYAVRSIEFSSNAFLSSYAILGVRGYLGLSAHGNNINYYFGGGNGYYTIQVGSYQAGETCTTFGVIDDTYEDAVSSMGNATVGLWHGGYLTNRIRYIELASQSNTMFWGYMGFSAYYQGTASIEEFGLAAGNGYYYTSNILQMNFDSMSNSTYWGYLSYSNGRMGGCNNANEALFTAGNNNRYDIISFASGGTAVSLIGFTNYGAGSLGFSGIG